MRLSNLRIPKAAALLAPVLSVGIWFASAAPATAQPRPPAKPGSAPNDKSEPAAQYLLQVNGVKLPMTLGPEVASKVAGQQIRFKLSRQPFRQFDKSGVKFQYPASYVFEADDSEPGLLVWTLTGGNSVVILQRFPKEPLPKLSADFNAEMVKQFGARNVVTTPYTMYLKGRKLAGRRLSIGLVGQKFTQDIFAFSTAKNSFILVIQDVPENGKTSVESTRLKVLIGQSLKW
jgi:hypothetical protein